MKCQKFNENNMKTFIKIYFSNLVDIFCTFVESVCYKKYFGYLFEHKGYKIYHKIFHEKTQNKQYNR